MEKKEIDNFKYYMCTFMSFILSAVWMIFAEAATSRKINKTLLKWNQLHVVVDQTASDKIITIKLCYIF